MRDGSSGAASRRRPRSRNFGHGPKTSPGEFAAIDAQAALLVAGDAFLPATLAPLPVAALPGWDAERLGERLLDDVSVFRPKMLRSSS